MGRDYSIEVVHRALRVLETLARAQGPLSLSAVAQALDIPRNAAFRLLYTLEGTGYVQKDAASKRYSLGLRLFELGNAVFHSSDWRDLARPVLQGLWTRFNETVNLGVLDDTKVLYVERLESPHSLRTSSRIGSRADAHATAMGKAMLACQQPEQVEAFLARATLRPMTAHTITDAQALRQELALTRERGYAIDNEENIEGVCCVGAAVLGRAGQVLAALSVSAPAQRLGGSDKWAEVGVAVTEAARELSRRLGYAG